MAISNVGLAVGAGIIGPLTEIFNWQYVILTYILFALVMLILMRFINFDKHQKNIEELELRLLESLDKTSSPNE